jgi:hypothetical protein
VRRKLLNELNEISEPTWAQRALKSCLQTIEDSGELSATHSYLVKIEDAWCGPGDQISIVYTPPWGAEAVGLRRTIDTSALGTYADYFGPEYPFSAESFGESVATWDLGEPLGTYADGMWHDSAGVRWWGDNVR